MPQSTVLNQLRRRASGALVNAVWNDRGGDTELTVRGLRGALVALDTPGNELLPCPPLNAGTGAYQAWRQQILRFRQSSFYMLEQEGLYAFVPAPEGWLCSHVDQEAHVMMLNEKFELEGSSTWSPLSIRTRLQHIQLAWGSEQTPPQSKSPPKVSTSKGATSTDWLSMLGHQLDRMRRQYHTNFTPPEGLKQQLEGFQLLIKSYVSSNARLDQLLVPAEPQEFKRNLSMLCTQGFTLRGSHHLWVLRKVANGWRVVGWDARQPDQVKYGILADAHLPLESGKYSSESLTTLLSFLLTSTGSPSPQPQPADIRTRTPLLTTAHVPTPPVSSARPTVLPRHRWLPMMKTEFAKLQGLLLLNEESNNRLAAADLRGRIRDLELIAAAHLKPAHALTEQASTTSDHEWQTRVRRLLSSGFWLDSMSGLWVFRPLDKAWEVLTWDCRTPETVGRRLLATLLRDPQDSSWPPSARASLLERVQDIDVRLGRLQDQPAVQPSASTPSVLANSVKTERSAAGLIALNDWRPQLDNAIKELQRTDLADSIIKQTVSDLRLLRRHYVVSNAALEKLLNKYPQGRNPRKVPVLYGQRFMVRGGEGVWFVQRAGDEWLITGWALKAPTQTVTFKLSGGQLSIETGGWTPEQVIAVLQQGRNAPLSVQQSTSGEKAFPGEGREQLSRSPLPERPRTSTLKQTSRAARPTVPPSRGLWPTLLKRAAVAAASAVSSQSSTEARRTQEQLARDLSMLHLALLDRDLILKPKLAAMSPRTWHTFFMREHGQRFTLISPTTLLLFLHEKGTWLVLRWTAERPDDVLRSVLPKTLSVSPPAWMPLEVRMAWSHAAAALTFSQSAQQAEPTPLRPLPPVPGQPIAAPASTALASPVVAQATGPTPWPVRPSSSLPARPVAGPTPTPSKPKRSGSLSDLLRRRIDVLERLAPLPPKTRETFERLQCIQRALTQVDEHLASPPVKTEERAPWEASVRAREQAGTFTLVAEVGLWTFQRTEDLWHVLGWTPEQSGQVDHRVLNLDLLDPRDDAWPPPALETWLEAIVLLLRPPEAPTAQATPAAELATLDPGLPETTDIPESQWLGLLKGQAWGEDAAPHLALVEQVLITPGCTLRLPPTAALARAAWDEDTYRLGLKGEFGIVGQRHIWAFQRQKEDHWQVFSWQPIKPEEVEVRALNSDFLDVTDSSWPPAEVEVLLEESAVTLQGLPRTRPASLLATWSGGGARLFQSVMGTLSAAGTLSELQRSRGEDGLAALWQHTRRGGLVWALASGREARSTRQLLAEGLVRTDALLRVLGGEAGTDTPTHLGDWDQRLIAEAAKVREAVAQAPAWQQHLLRGHWGAPQAGFQAAFDDHLETLEAYLQEEEVRQAEQESELSRLTLLAVLSWLTHFDDEGESSRQPWFNLHNSTTAMARRITRPPIASATQLARRVQSRFKLDARPEQITAIVQLVRSLGVHLMTLPTGAGKSLVYWTAADVFADLDGKTVIVSPLQALVGNQVNEARRHGLLAEALTGARDAQERLSLLQAYQEGRVQLLYVTPEQLVRHDVQQALRSCPPDLWVFDEAHTLSQWGMSFRPSYQQAVKVVADLGQDHARVLLTTATITHEEQQRLGEVFALFGPLQLTGQAFSLPEQLRITVQVEDDDNVRLRVMYEALEKARLARHQAIIYCATPDQAQQLAERLMTFFPNNQVGVYHGQLDQEQRRQREADFLSKRVAFLVATSAYGLGVNNPGVRLVIHAYPPPSVEDFVQQVGRATRHEEEAQALLLCAPRDLEIQFRLQARQQLQREDYRRVFSALREHARSLPSDARDLWLTPLEVGLLSRLSGDTAQIRLKGELALHRLVHEGVLRLNTLSPTPLEITETSDEAKEKPTHSPAAATLWAHLRRPDCDSASVADLVAAVQTDPESLLKQLCELQADGLLTFTYPIRVFINKGTRIAGLRVASQRLFAVQDVLLRLAQAQDVATDQIYRFSSDQLLTELNRPLAKVKCGRLG